ncbi:unnamed protein product [Closterium sp. NIES-64]|nr:unnamed protein product [Closterium sp. NIES-64]
MPFNSKFVQPMYEIMTAFNLDPEQNWSEGAPCSDDGTGSGFKGVICDSNGNPRAMIPTLGNSLVGLRSLPTAFARLTTLTRLVLIMGLINTRLDDFARPLSCLPNLRHLVLDGNSFYGPVPPYLINSPTLTDLSLQGNKLTGTIRKIGPKLTALFLSVNFLTGPLPPAARRLRVCNAAMNCLSRTSGCNGVTGFPRRQRTIGCRRNPCAKRKLLNSFQCKWAKSCIPQYGDWPPWEVDALSNPPDKGWKCNSCPTGTYATRRRCVPCSKPLIKPFCKKRHSRHRATDPMSQLTSAAALVARPLPPPPTVLLPPAFAQRPAALLPRRKHASPNHAPLKLRAPLVLRASATSSQREPPEGSDSRPPPPPMKVMSRSAKNVRRMMSAASPPALGQFRPPPLPSELRLRPSLPPSPLSPNPSPLNSSPVRPRAPMFPMGAPGGEDSGEAEEGRRKERERREELIAAVREGCGSWQEVAAAIRQLQQAGMTAEEVADVAMLAHGQVTVLVVAAQVYESLLPGAQEVEGDGPDSSFDVAVAFHAEQSAELLYELRTLPTAGRRQAAAYVAQQGLDAGGVRELVRAMRDHARRSNSREGFSSAPGDCLAFMCYRAAGESSGEERREWVERGLAAAVSESARARLRELQ